VIGIVQSMLGKSFIGEMMTIINGGDAALLIKINELQVSLISRIATTNQILRDDLLQKIDEQKVVIEARIRKQKEDIDEEIGRLRVEVEQNKQEAITANNRLIEQMKLFQDQLDSIRNERIYTANILVVGIITINQVINEDEPEATVLDLEENIISNLAIFL